MSRRATACGAGADRLPQLARALRRRCIERLDERRGEVVVDGQRRSALALQIVQLHQAARRGLVERIGGNETLRQGAAFGQPALALERVDAGIVALALAQAQCSALHFEPCVELTAVGVAQAGEQLAVAVAVLEIVGNAGRQRQQLGARPQNVGIEAAPQPEQALPQEIARALGGMPRPQQLEQALARGRAFDRNEGEQRRIDGRQRLQRTVGAAHRGAAGQHQVQRTWIARLAVEDRRRRHRCPLPRTPAAI